MYRSILVATDGSPLSEKAIQSAISLAAALNARLVGLYAKPVYSAPVYSEGAAFMSGLGQQEFARHNDADADRILSRVSTLAGAAGVPIETSSREATNPFEAIIAAATDHGCDLIVMASHGRRGLSGLVLGSETQKVLTHSTTPVLVIR